MSAVRWRFYRTTNGRDVVREELESLGVQARAAVAEAMKRVARREHFPYEQEHLDGDLLAVRVFLDGCTYRMLYAREGARDHILLGLHVFQKKDRKLPPPARRLAERRLRDWRGRRV
ncbi:type II toxin-antitoxin system RelE/ParE family toxin [Actinopolymorpha alba]|uniref:type II toxin-antitoxin system RelE/ParE family toxin n=1 Tax=Actinopolymorpha alba TaxID=533267 RepID=UPI0003651D56|nr:type II toxin-antitoxin system RelE/ParE family toxin [Actinopolymorpha alba]